MGWVGYSNKSARACQFHSLPINHGGVTGLADRQKSLVDALQSPIVDVNIIVFNQQPHYASFRVFGCQVFPYLQDYSKHKLAPQSISCIFIGYSLQYKGYKCLDPSTSRIYVTRHAR
ncbi:hypothetical protein OSB04_019461 [Centaurea solstitialis]|uniref:Retroviral polymerase SH3-like domain-containing protein n=1 Tax=Centaurea solstitialis TaxID=347529 RepID=A0AA38SY21_9ASTR|nr:hypothetical protein OSB04_019461 [Centaurea solstitialis]